MTILIPQKNNTEPKRTPFLCTGFYQELQALQEDYEDADFGFLENEMAGAKLNAYDFLHGLCHIFATCLQYIFRYDIQAVYDEHGNLIHAYCTKEHPIYGTVFIDVRGCTNDSRTFLSEFEDFVTISEDEPIMISGLKPDVPESEYRTAAQRLIERYREYYCV